MLHHAHHLHPKKKKDIFDYLVYFFMVATPLFEIPQVYAIYSTQDATSVSLITWGFFLMASVVWFIYGLRQKLLPLIVAYSLYFIIELILVIGIVRYS